MNASLNAGVNTVSDGGGSAIESLTCKTSVLSSTGVFTFEVDGFLNLSDEVGGAETFMIYETQGRSLSSLLRI